MLRIEQDPRRLEEPADGSSALGAAGLRLFLQRGRFGRAGRADDSTWAGLQIAPFNQSLGQRRGGDGLAGLGDLLGEGAG